MIRVQKNMLSPVTFKGGSKQVVKNVVAVKPKFNVFEHGVSNIKPDADQRFITEAALCLKNKARNAFISFGILTNNLSGSVSQAAHNIKTTVKEKLFGAAIKVVPVIRTISKSFC